MCPLTKMKSWSTGLGRTREPLCVSSLRLSNQPSPVELEFELKEDESRFSCQQTTASQVGRSAGRESSGCESFSIIHFARHSSRKMSASAIVHFVLRISVFEYSSSQTL